MAAAAGQRTAAGGLCRRGTRIAAGRSASCAAAVSVSGWAGGSYNVHISWGATCKQVVGGRTGQRAGKLASLQSALHAVPGVTQWMGGLSTVDRRRGQGLGFADSATVLPALLPPFLCTVALGLPIPITALYMVQDMLRTCPVCPPLTTPSLLPPACPLLPSCVAWRWAGHCQQQLVLLGTKTCPLAHPLLMTPPPSPCTFPFLLVCSVVLGLSLSTAAVTALSIKEGLAYGELFSWSVDWSQPLVTLKVREVCMD